MNIEDQIKEFDKAKKAERLEKVDFEKWIKTNPPSHKANWKYKIDQYDFFKCKKCNKTGAIKKITFANIWQLKCDCNKYLIWQNMQTKFIEIIDYLDYKILK